MMVMVTLGPVLGMSNALAFTGEVLEPPEGNPVRGFRWLVEEDTSREMTPGVYQPPDETVRLSVYRSHSSVVKAGHANGASASISVHSGKHHPKFMNADIFV